MTDYDEYAKAGGCEAFEFWEYENSIHLAEAEGAWLHQAEEHTTNEGSEGVMT
ncbi:MAG: hypothetical protein KAS32_24820 [Candidatus Peribacteraceae bacterium]|nr:hypothetical protein [Candidatus Peribacteraceae bacterium]